MPLATYVDRPWIVDRAAAVFIMRVEPTSLASKCTTLKGCICAVCNVNQCVKVRLSLLVGPDNEPWAANFGLKKNM